MMKPLKTILNLIIFLFWGFISACQSAPATITEIPTLTSAPTQTPDARETPILEVTPTDTPITPFPTLTPRSGEADADVLFVRAILQSDGTWTFHVTVEHPDTGWEDYTDGWDVLTPDGEVLKRNPEDPFTRLLLHPHVDEQPFTRTQAGITVPEGIEQVFVRAHDLISGFGGKEVLVDLTKAAGPNFEVSR